LAKSRYLADLFRLPEMFNVYPGGRASKEAPQGNHEEIHQTMPLRAGDARGLEFLLVCEDTGTLLELLWGAFLGGNNQVITSGVGFRGGWLFVRSLAFNFDAIALKEPCSWGCFLDAKYRWAAYQHCYPQGSDRQPNSTR
jgi:hypothetical protein